MASVPYGWRIAAGTGVLVPLALLVLSETLLRPDHEVLYTSSFSSTCVPTRDGETCYATQAVSVANNGRVGRDDVRLEFGKSFQGWVLTTRFSDLVGSPVKRSDPEVSETTDDEKSVYHIRRFEPNTVVDFEIKCLPCAREQIRPFKDTPLRVHGQGSVVNAEPRGAMAWRAWRNLVRVLWTFG